MKESRQTQAAGTIWRLKLEVSIDRYCAGSNSGKQPACCRGQVQMGMCRAFVL